MSNLRISKKLIKEYVGIFGNVRNITSHIAALKGDYSNVDCIMEIATFLGALLSQPHMRVMVYLAVDEKDFPLLHNIERQLGIKNQDVGSIINQTFS